MNIPKLTLFVVLATSVTAGCSKGSKEPTPEVAETKTPVEEFRSLFVTDSDQYKKVYEDEIKEGIHYKRSVLVWRDSIRIDVRKTESLVTPLVGIVTFKFQQIGFTDYGSARNIRGELMGTSSDTNNFDGKFEFSYQSDQWVESGFQSRYLVDGKSPHGWQDDNEGGWGLPLQKLHEAIIR